MEVEDIWRRKSDDEIQAAASSLDEYTELGRAAIRAEITRRGLAFPDGGSLEAKGDLQDDRPLPEYLKVGMSFGLGGGFSGSYVGFAIASSDAIFLVPHANIVLGTILGALGGAAAGAAGSAVGWLVGQLRAPTATSLGKLPAEIRDHDDWPIKNYQKLHPDCPVIIVPRASVTVTQLQSFGGLLVIRTPGRVFQVELSLWGRNRVRAFLRELGWIYPERATRVKALLRSIGMFWAWYFLFVVLSTFILMVLGMSFSGGAAGASLLSRALDLLVMLGLPLLPSAFLARKHFRKFEIIAA